MKCIKCRTENVHNANYCKECGYHFSEKEQKAAEKRTFVGFLKLIDNVKDKVTLDFIKGKLWFQILSVIVILGIGIYFLFINGINLKLIDSDKYEGTYNEKLNEYYLYSDEYETELNLYIPDRTKKIIVKHYDMSDSLLSEDDYNVEDNIVLVSNSNDDYYIVEAQYKNNNFDRLKLYIYQSESGDK